ncbi:MAG: SsrA-binding protein SmpB [Firmicutes bacterium]|nr:SsrA-binding protein SmpB [Bacillota bacterium]
MAQGNVASRKPGGDGEKVLVQNKKATHDYFIEETYEAGLVLTGTEIKSIRNGRANIRDSYARVDHGEVFLHNLHISPYEAGNRFNHDPLRTRKLLLKRSEIRKLIGATRESGYSLVPLRLYLRGGFCKVQIALAKGKKNYDKRHSIAERDASREIARAFRERQKE